MSSAIQLGLIRVGISTLSRKKESRKRNLHFHLPAAVLCAPNLRLLQNDASYINLGDIYDQHCEDAGMAREEPVMMIGEKVKVAMREFKQRNGRSVGCSRTINESSFAKTISSPTRENTNCSRRNS